MSALPLARIALLALALLLAAAVAGFVAGMLGGGAAPSAANATAAAVTSAAPRDVGLALLALDAHGHWGRYDAPEAAAGTAVADSAPAVPGAEGLARDYRLVGIERDSDGARALLLPVASEGAAEAVMALRVGAEFAPGVRVLRIETDAVVFATGDGESTLHLYEPGS